MTEANDTLTRRNSYLFAIENDDMISHAAEESKDEPSDSDTNGGMDDGNHKKKKAINFCQALLIPGVIVVSILFHHIYMLCMICTHKG